MSEETHRNGKKVRADEQQSDEVAEANKPDGARADDQTKAGNILGSVQPK